jgi:hypothetical protein
VCLDAVLSEREKFQYLIVWYLDHRNPLLSTELDFNLAVRGFNVQFLSNIWSLLPMGEFTLTMRFRTIGTFRQPAITADLSFLALVTDLITQC